MHIEFFHKFISSFLWMHNFQYNFEKFEIPSKFIIFIILFFN